METNQGEDGSQVGMDGPASEVKAQEGGEGCPQGQREPGIVCQGPRMERKPPAVMGEDLVAVMEIMYIQGGWSYIYILRIMEVHFLTAGEGQYKYRKKNKMNLGVLYLNESDQDELTVFNI